MEALYNYITAPETIVSFVIFVFWLWAVYKDITTKQKDIEKRLEKIEDLDLDSRLTRMETILEYIRVTLDEFKKNH